MTEVEISNLVFGSHERAKVCLAAVEEIVVACVQGKKNELDLVTMVVYDTRFANDVERGWVLLKVGQAMALSGFVCF